MESLCAITGSFHRTRAWAWLEKPFKPFKLALVCSQTQPLSLASFLEDIPWREEKYRSARERQRLWGCRAGERCFWRPEPRAARSNIVVL